MPCGVRPVAIPCGIRRQGVTEGLEQVLCRPSTLRAPSHERTNLEAAARRARNNCNEVPKRGAAGTHADFAVALRFPPRCWHGTCSRAALHHRLTARQVMAKSRSAKKRKRS